MSQRGYVHSIETMGTVDGPGIRVVVFFQGCPLRCKYCHNPDTWKLADGREISVDEVMKDILKYKSYMRFSGGGVTFSGGEPLMQPEFLKELLKRCKENGIHTAVDTSGYVNNSHSDEILKYTDMLLLDVKAFDEDIYKKVTNVEQDKFLKFLKKSTEKNIPTWLRYVVVPNLTSEVSDVERLMDFLEEEKLTNIEKIEILPFHKMGEYKWEEMGYEYELQNTDEPEDELIENIRTKIEDRGFVCN